MAADALEHLNAKTEISNSGNFHILGEAHSEPFKIDRGTNESLRARDPFSQERMDEIVSKVRIGTDLMEEQLTRVQNLVRTYADIFAMTLSEVDM